VAAVAFVGQEALDGAAPAAGNIMSKGDMTKGTMGRPINMERRRDEMEKTSTGIMAADQHADLFADNETLF
jgi:hypothetical protein